MSFKLSLFEQPNPIWCFVFVTLFNLQGTHRLAAAGVILPHHFDLVKSFFKVFSNFFQLLRSARQASPCFVTLTGDSISLPYLSLLVKNFFRTVRWFLFSHSSSLLIWKTSLSSGICPPRRALAYNIRLTPDCQLFFQFFSSFFLDEK